MTMTLQADSGLCQTAASWDTVEYSDNCAVLQLISTHQSGDTFEVGTTTVSMTLEDIHGNSAAHSFDVIVEDNQLPSISGMPANIWALDQRRVQVSNCFKRSVAHFL